MLRPLIQRPRHNALRSNERGVTMAIVALSLVAIISMAAISIDLGSLYEAKSEAQRAADLAALAAARIISLEGVTGDPLTGPSDGSWNDICGGPTSPATLAAVNVAQQNLIGGAAAPAADISVYYGTSAGVGTATSCTGAGVGFTVNPVVQVHVQQPNLPNFFSRVFSLITHGTSKNSGVSATATAEVYNSSGSGSLPTGMIPPQPRCVKPWIIPNRDPGNPVTPFLFVDTTSGVIQNPGVYQIAGSGVVGESFTLNADCKPGQSNCEIGSNILDNPPKYNSTNEPGFLGYVPALVSNTGTAVAVPSCSASTGYQAAIAGCDQSTVYACGTPSGTQVDLTENPLNPAGFTGDTPTAVACLIKQGFGGQDVLAGFPPNTSITYPFAIQAGFGNPLVQAGVVNNNNIITTSSSIVTLPIYDGATLNAVTQPLVTVVGYLQVFINQVNPDGSLNVTVMNVAGCGNTAPASTVGGTSPVPIRLITPP